MRTALLVAVLIALAAAAAAAAVPPYDETKVYPTEGAFNSSIKVYQDALTANPKDADAAYWLGAAYWTASVLYRHEEIGYGEDYLDRAIDSLERAVKLDDTYLAAWQLLAIAYFTRDRWPNPWSNNPEIGDQQRTLVAEQKVLELSRDLRVSARGVPGWHSKNGEVAIRYAPLPDRTVRFRALDYLVVADPDTKLVYKFPCAGLPPIKRPMMFLTKWEAINRGFVPATVCPP